MPPRPGRLTLPTAATAVGLVLLTACGADESGAQTDADGTTELTVYHIPTVNAGPLYLGIEQGFFTEQGLDVSVEVAEAGSAIVPAVMSQESPIGYANSVSDLQAIDQGLDVRIIANCSGGGSDPELDTSQVFVLPDGDITSAADLAHANIAVNSVNNLGDLVIIEALANQGVPTDDIEFTPMPYSDMPSALERGDVDAIWQVEPHKTISENHGFTPLLATFTESFPDAMTGFYITSAEFAQENPEVVAGFQAAMDASNDYATDHPDDVLQMIVDHQDMDPEIAPDVQVGTYEPGVDVDGLHTIAQAAVEHGFIEAEPDYDEIIIKE